VFQTKEHLKGGDVV
jgi:hypothetical protein